MLRDEVISEVCLLVCQIYWVILPKHMNVDHVLGGKSSDLKVDPLFRKAQVNLQPFSLTMHQNKKCSSSNLIQGKLKMFLLLLLMEWCSLLEHHMFPYGRRAFWGCCVQTAQHPVVSLWVLELILCVTHGLAQLHCWAVPSNSLLSNAGFSQKVLPSAPLNCFIMFH